MVVAIVLQQRAITISSLLYTSIAFADTTDVKTQTIVEVKKAGEHCEQDPHCFNRYHSAIQAVAKANPGDLIVVHTLDALDSNLTIDLEPKDVLAIDLNLIHPVTGPIHIEGAVRGDVLAVQLIDINPDEYGYTIFFFYAKKFSEWLTQ